LYVFAWHDRYAPREDVDHRDSVATVVPALLAQDLSSKSIGHQVVLDSGSGLRVHVTKAFRPDWYSVNDRVGFVDRNPRRIIADALQCPEAIPPRTRRSMIARENSSGYAKPGSHWSTTE
jgi:hypothetical protein